MSVLTSADTRPQPNGHPLVYMGEKNTLIIYALKSDAHTNPLGEKKSPTGQGRNGRFHSSGEAAVHCIWSAVTHSQYQ